DPTASTMRARPTCNGGEGTDWNVIQNWSGTYGGSAKNYDRELRQPVQLLNGEYGAWRTIGLHSEAKDLEKEKAYSEEKFTNILETKMLLAESASDSVCGHFQWIMNSHDNPGRTQPDEGLRMIDKIGPFNHKGLTTVWEQPTDAFHMYRAHHTSPDTDPMVYIVSHTWTDRFKETGSRRT
ncbi:beta-galactosidase, partial [Parabacteroides distasonis]